MSAPEPITDERLQKLLRAALAEGQVGPLVERLERSSGLPNRPNWGFARMVGAAIAGERSAGRVLLALASGEPPFGRIVAGFALATRLGTGAEPTELTAFESLCGDERRFVREGAVLALRDTLAAHAGALATTLRTFAPLEDGLLHAAVLIEALCDRAVLDRVTDGAEVVRVLEAAMARADGASRSEERLQGLRELRLRLPDALAAACARYRVALDWLERELTAAKESAAAPRERRAFMRPETHALWQETVRLLGRKKLGTADLERLYALSDAGKKPPRDTARVVEGTRKRGGRRR
ncbi:MAG: hypothetical protein IT373_30415 [Polyangiaceae bacterium]|nr:hypothetical protein [Polyangiaceae bacterium]